MYIVRADDQMLKLDSFVEHPVLESNMSAFTPLPPPPDGDVNKGPAILAVAWFQFPIALAFVAARMYTRRCLLRNVGWDDWTIVIALVSSPQTRKLC